MPEGHYFLSQACLYLATAPKSNSAGAIWQALGHIEQHGSGDVPPYLRDKSDSFRGPVGDQMRQTTREASGDHGAYQYPHDFPDGWVDQQYLPLGMEPPGWYRPKNIGYEREIRERFERLGKE
jgi:putative ATPase